MELQTTEKTSLKYELGYRTSFTHNTIYTNRNFLNQKFIIYYLRIYNKINNGQPEKTETEFDFGRYVHGVQYMSVHILNSYLNIESLAHSDTTTTN